MIERGDRPSTPRSFAEKNAMAYDNMEGGCSAQMKCPHCGETIDLNASKSSEPASESQSEDMDKDKGFEEGLREYMSPRNDDQTP